MTIRKASRLEIDYLLQLSGKVLKESSMGHMENDIHTAYNMFLPFIQNGGYYLIDEENRRLKGWVLLGIDRYSMVDNTIGHILQLYVFPRYRKAGVGRKLMKQAMKEFQARGIKTAQLNVFAGNPAHILYKKLGFKEVSTIMELTLDKKDMS
ncbi:MAG TPA: GNAT family N-acetyltransferase [Chondromyces sp.]|nr:GNAT family N-acetyltransferase [Chondromyces sp.]